MPQDFLYGLLKKIRLEIKSIPIGSTVDKFDSPSTLYELELGCKVQLLRCLKVGGEFVLGLSINSAGLSNGK